MNNINTHIRELNHEHSKELLGLNLGDNFPCHNPENNK